MIEKTDAKDNAVNDLISLIANDIDDLFDRYLTTIIAALEPLDANTGPNIAKLFLLATMPVVSRVLHFNIDDATTREQIHTDIETVLQEVADEVITQERRHPSPITRHSSLKAN